MADRSYTIPSLSRAINVMAMLACREEAMTLAELALQTDIPKSTLYRILATLQEQRCVFKDEASKRYRLGPKLWELGSAFVAQIDLSSAAVPHMKQLAEACEGSVFLGIMDNGEVLYVRRIESPKSVLAVRKLGQRAPAYCTATGEALMASMGEEEVSRLLQRHPPRAHTAKTETNPAHIKKRLARVRQRGVAVVDGEYNEQLLCVSAPVLDEGGQARASLTVALLSERASRERVEHVRSQVRQAAQDLSRELGFAGRSGTRQAPAPHEANAGPPHVASSP